MNRFEIEKTPIEGVFVVKAKPIGDARGYFERFFCSDEFNEIGFNAPVAQINHSLNNEVGVVRGIHFQWPPYNEMKLVRCINGEVYDVAVDLRKGSSTFLKYFGVKLSQQEHNYLLLPNGMGHAYQSLTAGAELIYVVSAPFTPEADCGLNPQDPAIGISWPVKIGQISDKDRNRKFIDKTFMGIDLGSLSGK